MTFNHLFKYMHSDILLFIGSIYIEKVLRHFLIFVHKVYILFLIYCNKGFEFKNIYGFKLKHANVNLLTKIDTFLLGH